MKKIIAAFGLLVAFGCTDIIENSSGLSASSKGGYVPSRVVNEVELRRYSISDPKAVQTPGKTFLDGRYLYVLEYGQGIHVFDNVVPASPRQMLFINIPAITDYFVTGETLVCDNGDNLVAFNISAVRQVVVLGKRVSDVASNAAFFSILKTQEQVFDYPNYPTGRNIHFQCADSVGYVTAWKLDTAATNLNCYR